MTIENNKANYCPRCGQKCNDGVCPYHGKIILGTPLRVCLNGHIVEVLPDNEEVKP